MNINPFILSPAIPDEFFCDRQSESASLIKSIGNQENIVLISPRRVGKTGLIYHCFNQPEISDNYITVSIDILHTTSFQEFISCVFCRLYDISRADRGTGSNRTYPATSSRCKR